MRSFYKIALPVLAIATIITVFSCKKKTEDNQQYEDWTVRNYCEPLRPGVVCFQNDTLDITLCCGDVNKHFDGEKTLLRTDGNILYYRLYLHLLKSYTLE